MKIAILPLLRQAWRFSIVGVVGTVVYWPLYWWLTVHMDVFYLKSSLIAFSANTILFFLVQKLWTFENKEMETAQSQFWMYFGVRSAYFVINASCLFLLVEQQYVGPIWAQVIVTIVLTLPYFFLTKLIFKNREEVVALPNQPLLNGKPF